MKDSHSGTDAQRVLLLVWSGAGAVIGALLGAAAGFLAGSPGAFAAVTGAAIGGAGTFFGVGALANTSGRLAFSLFSPSGDSTPDRPELSLAESLAARGRYREAAAEYERAIAARPEDPQPYLRLGRLCRDRLDDAEAAARRFIEAITLARDPNAEHLAVRELTELCTGPLHAPHRAFPHLARHAARHPGTAQARWARETLVSLRQRSS